MIFKCNCRYGLIKDNYLIIYKLNYKKINLNTITEVKISERQTTGKLNFINYFKKKMYDFTIIVGNSKEITFSFGKTHLSKAIAFKTRIYHSKFSLQETILEKPSDADLEVKYRF